MMAAMAHARMLPHLSSLSASCHGAKRAALFFHYGLAAMATAAERPQVAHQVRSAGCLWDDVVNMSFAARHDPATLLALPVVEEQPFSPGQTP
jgi:hypothetical protein